MAAYGGAALERSVELVLAALRHPNLELAGVVYSWGARRSMCAARDPAGAFWMFGGRDPEPRCLGRDVTDVLAGQVALVAYQRPGGAAQCSRLSRRERWASCWGAIYRHIGIFKTLMTPHHECRV